MGRSGSALIFNEMKSNWLWFGVPLLPLIFLGLFYVFPLAKILQISLLPSGTLDLEAPKTFLTSGRYWQILWFTTRQATYSTVLTLALALPGAYVFTRYRFPGKSLLMSLAILPFVLPTVVVAAAFKALIDDNGVLNEFLMGAFNLNAAPIELERTLAMILIAHVFYNYGAALRIISGYWANQTRKIEEAAQILGADGWRLWVYVRLPLLRPAILAAAILVFIFTFTSFGVILILGGLRFSTLEIAIFREARDFFDLPMAATLSIVQIGFMLALLLIYTRLQRGISAGLESEKQVARRPQGWPQHLMLWVNLVVIAILVFAPLAALVMRSLTVGEGNLTLEHYSGLNASGQFDNPLNAIGNSLRFAVLATLLSLSLGVLTAYLVDGQFLRRFGRLSTWLDPLFMLPLATSAVTLGFGYVVAMDFDGVRLLINQGLSLIGLGVQGDWDMRTSSVLIPLAHTLVALPFVVRSVLPAVRAVPRSGREAAVVLGAGRWRVWRWIDLPLISRGILVGATFAFTISMGEFGASLFIARPDTPTLPIVIYNQINRPGTANYGEALALSVILMMICAIGFIFIERFRSIGIGEF